MIKKSKKLIIVGIGETANLAHEYFSYDSDYEVAAFAVHRELITEKTFKGLAVEAVEDLVVKFSSSDFDVFIAMASAQLNYQRTKIFNEIKSLGYTCASYISSKSFVWHNVKIGENCFILEDNTLQPFVIIGNNVTLWSGNHIGHQSIIHDNCFLTSHVVISGFCEIGNNTFIGVNASIADNIIIAPDNLIAMGAVINKSTNENSIYKGNPATRVAISAKQFYQIGD
ncbi:MAG: acetyltransferase [Paludibacter sp.]|nr:acetyltransferase [Paludibacter sp.]